MTSPDEIPPDDIEDIYTDELDADEEPQPGEGGMYEHFRFVADKGQQLLRVDKFLVAHMQLSLIHI